MSVPTARTLGRVRFADALDVKPIMALFNESTLINFRISEEVDVNNLIVNNVMSIVQLDGLGSIVGFLSLKDYPLQNAIHSSAWEEALWNIYRSVELNSRNTLFIHLFCWTAGYGRELVDNLLRTVFLHDAYLQHIAVIKPLEKYQLLFPGHSADESSFRKVQAMVKMASSDKMPSLWIVDREEICPRLKVRRAVEEDNDDIIPILDDHSPILKQTYGEYYISELVAHPGSRVLLVCEDKEKVAVGIMCLNTQINYEALENAYVLSPFTGLKKFKEPEIIEKPVKNESFDEFNYYISNSTLSAKSTSYSNLDSKSDLRVARISWTSEPTKRTYSNRSVAEIFNFFQDEDIDYEIINIEQELMIVPPPISFEQSPCLAEFRTFLENLPESHGSFDGKIIRVAVTEPKTPPIEAVHFTGEPNAFLLELFAIHPDIDERFGIDILMAAYEIFPDREYCILSLPSNHTPFPLLEHFTMVVPANKASQFTKQILYVAHVNSIRGSLRVRPGEGDDLQYLHVIVARSGRHKVLTELFQTSLKPSSRVASYVLLSENQPVGVVIIGPQEGRDLLRLQFNIDPEAKNLSSDGMIFGAVVSPLFEPHFRWLIREVLRQSDYRSLFWPFSVTGDATPQRNLMMLTNHMVPFYSRTVIQNLTGQAYLNILTEKSAKLRGYCAIDRPLTSLPKIDINNNIVVVGSSCTGLSFIETLVMGVSIRYLNFTNVTLVSHTGIPGVMECLNAAVTCVPVKGRFTNRYMKKAPFVTYIDVVIGTMIKIDRKQKCIVLKENKVVFYDTLVLTCGLQFQHPAYLKQSLKEEASFRQGKPCTHRRMDDPQYKPDRVTMTSELPRNIMIINDIHRANFCLRKLMALIEDCKTATSCCLNHERKIIVNGNTLEVYTCMAALLELKIDPKHITFAESYYEDDWPNVNCFNDEKVDERVQRSIESLGIQVYRRCNLVDWTMRWNYVKSVTMMTHHRKFQLDCFALFFYGRRSLDLNTFKAINDSGLVYDGGLVIGAEFETNDPHIYAAGTCTRYSRRLYADKYLHKYYYSEDVGESLAVKFLNHLDPFMRTKEEEKSPSSALPGYSDSLLKFLGSHMTIPRSDIKFEPPKLNSWEPVPRFESPLYVYATLPGPLYYLRMRKPGPDIPMEVALSLPHQGHLLETESNGNFYRLEFSTLQILKGATCLCESKFQSNFYIMLYGKHESFFNNLFARYQMNLIKDLNEYLTQPWISVLYLACFNSVFENIEAFQVVMNKRPAGNIRSIMYRCIGKKYTDQCIDRVRRRLIKDLPKVCGQNSKVREEMASLWNILGGDGIVWHYLSKYLHLYGVTHPQFMKPKPEYATIPEVSIPKSFGPYSIHRNDLHGNDVK